MNIYKKLSEVQMELKAPKNQYNSFGKYKYRSCEDILETAKPLCIEKGLILTVSDRIEVKENRFYVVATAKIIDIETEKEFCVEAYAREEESKKGMDGSQVTGASSSYARKYALNGLFCIDDTKDADTNEHKQQQCKSTANSSNTPNKAFDKDKAIKACLDIIGDDMDKLDKITSHYKVEGLMQMSEAQLKDCYKNLKK